jgi:tetratricopeptide (TPR) repeat protein/transcriptional regulator with XRE-family HTH domain
LLKRYREAAGWTQEALAEAAGLSVRGLRYLERDESRPYPETVRHLVTALALTPAEQAAFTAAARTDLRVSPVAPPAAESERAGGATGPNTGQPPLLGRERELALLSRHLAGEGPPALLLAGEPGIGKSRLLWEARGLAEAAGWCVLQGSCSRSGGGQPYAPLAEALERLLAALPAAAWRPALQGCAWLVRLLPELADSPIEPLPAWTAAPEHERRLMFAAVERFLANVAGPTGTLLLLDDLQWAGSDAFDLLATLLRAADEVPLRVIGAYRDTEVTAQHPLAVLLADLGHAGLATRHTLAPLQTEEAAQLVAALLAGQEQEMVSQALQERILQRASGVPFFLVSCAQGVRAGALAGGGEDAVPWDVAQGIRQRVAALAEGARAILGVAAVLGRMVESTLLLAVAARPEEEVLVALEAATQARLLLEAGEGYQFAHDVIREVVEADVGLARRRMLHRRAAEALEQGQGERQVELLVYHYSRAGVPEKTLLYLEQAGDKAARQGAYAAAESHFQQVAEGLGQRGLLPDMARIREKLALVLRTAARFDTRLSLLDRAPETHGDAEDRESLARAPAKIDFFDVMRGTPEEAIARLRPLLGIAEAQGQTLEFATLYAMLAGSFFGSGRYVEAQEASAKAADLARALGDDRLLAQVNAYGAVCLFKAGRAKPAGRVQEAIRITEEVIRLAEAVGDDRILWNGWNNLAYVHACKGDIAASRQHFHRAAVVAARMRDLSFITFATAMDSWIAILLGEWGRARVESEQAVALSRQARALWAAPYALLHRGQLRLLEGHWEEAARCLEEAIDLAGQKGDRQALRQATGFLAEAEILAGRTEAAVERLIPLLVQSEQEHYDVTALLPVLAWAYLELGEASQAAQVAAQAIARTRPEGLHLVLVDGLRVRALACLRQGQVEEATAALEEGLSLARAMPHPYAEARLMRVFGEVQMQERAMQAAREQFGAALVTFRRLGARKDLERVEQALATLG